jgi:hypothetical protein
VFTKKQGLKAIKLVFVSAIDKVSPDNLSKPLWNSIRIALRIGKLIMAASETHQNYSNSELEELRAT